MNCQMEAKKPKYRIYPSVLDKFQELLDYQLVAEEDWNKVSQSAKDAGKYPDLDVDDYILSPDEMQDKIENELIDFINRVPHEPCEAADKGTAFNELIDCLIANRPCGIEGMTIEKVDSGLHVSYHGFEWLFDEAFCREFADNLSDSVSQLHVSSTIETEYGLVELYGYIDEYRLNQVIDIKTTGRYDFLKFERKWQRHVYPYCLVEDGNEVQGFEYRVVVWKGGTKTSPALYGNVIPEFYTYDHEQTKTELKGMLEQFIGWLEDNSDRITDKKIFGFVEEEKPKITIADDVDSDFIIGDNFRYLPSNLGKYSSMEEAIQKLSSAGLFATSEGVGATRALSEDEVQEIRDSITDIVENERIDAARDLADALAFEERMKAEIKRRKERAQEALNEIDDRIMLKAKQVKENKKTVSLDGTDTVRISVSDKNLYYHLDNGALVLAYVGYASNDEMSALFFQSEVNEKAMKELFGIQDFCKERHFDVFRISDMADEELIGRSIIVDPEKTSIENFVDEDSGIIGTTKKTEKFGLKKLPVKITDEILSRLKNEGYKTVIVSKEEE